MVSHSAARASEISWAKSPVLDLRTVTTRLPSASYSIFPACSSSGGSMPTILTYPPSGMALMPYSVSPRCLLQTVGPKPMKYCVTFPPNALAGIMWPSSCNPIEARIASTKATTPRT